MRKGSSLVKEEEVNKMSQKKSTHNLWTSNKVPGPELRTRRHQIITTKGWMIKEPQNGALIKFSSIMMTVNSGQFDTQLPVGVFYICCAEHTHLLL